MTTKLKLFGMAALLTSVMATPAHSATLYQSLSVDLVLSYQAPAETNARSGEITDKKLSSTINTAKFLSILAGNLGVSSLGHGAALVKATALAEGVNFTTLITNSTSLVSNATFLVTNIIPTNFVYENTTTNGPLFITNGSPETPTGYFLSDASGYDTNLGTFATNLVQAQGQSVIVGTNVTYYLFTGGAGALPDDPTTDARFIPLGRTNSNNGGSASAADEAPNFLNTSVAIDDQNNNDEGDSFSNGALTNFFLAQMVTNTAGIFSGTIKTNMRITGTIYGDNDSLTAGPAAGTVGVAASPYISVNGNGSANAVTANVGSGKSALPFSSWNATFAVNGYATTGGTISNIITTNSYTYLTTSNVMVTYPYNYNEPTNSYTNISTNLYTNYLTPFTSYFDGVSIPALNYTNYYIVTGTVKQTFMAIK